MVSTSKTGIAPRARRQTNTLPSEIWATLRRSSSSSSCPRFNEITMTADWVCKFWLRGTCKRGAFCKALHKITPVNVSDAGEFLESVNRRSLLRATKSIPPVTWSDDEFLCSYNWVDRDTPTIYVPGRRTRNPEHTDNLTGYQEHHRCGRTNDAHSESTRTTIRTPLGGALHVMRSTPSNHYSVPWG